MSQDTVKVVRAGFEAFNTGRTDVYRELYDPDVIMRAPEGWPEPGPFVGRGAVMRQWEQLRETWSADASEVVSDFVDVGDRVAVRFIWRGTGHGPEASMELTSLTTVRKGKMFYLEFFWDHAEALENLGVPEQPVAPSNLDLARSIYAAWDRGDYTSTEWAHPEIEFLLAGEGPSNGSWTGLAGLAEGWRTWLSAWEEFRSEADDYRELDGERVLVLVHFSGRGKASGLELGQMRTKGASLFHVRGGKVTRLVIYTNYGHALTELGLSPEAGGEGALEQRQ